MDSIERNNLASTQNHSFPRALRLKNALHISALFTKADSYTVFPLKLLWREFAHTSSLKIAFSVPKRTFKRAVMRNLIRRRAKEAFRMNQHDLDCFLQKNNLHLECVVLYIGKKEADFATIQTAMQQLLSLLLNKCKKKFILPSLSTELKEENENTFE